MPDRYRKIVIVLGAAVCLMPFMSPPAALLVGIAAALSVGNPFGKHLGKAVKILLQISVVGLGFGMPLDAVVEAGRTGFLFTVGTIFGVLGAGYLIGRRLGLSRRLTHLISSGTAICGGSAIAAVGPVVDADPAEMSVSLGIVFILNAIALLVFPLVGELFSLTQTQFGIWAAIAIHDTSSVVGAASKYGAEALQIATTIKLSRALWIIPLAIGSAFLFRKRTKKFAFPYFILLYVAASALVSYTDIFTSAAPTIVKAAKQGLVLTLFLIGAGFTRASVRAVGYRPMVMGVTLWILISVVSLVVILNVL